MLFVMFVWSSGLHGFPEMDYYCFFVGWMHQSGGENCILEGREEHLNKCQAEAAQELTFR